MGDITEVKMVPALDTAVYASGDLLFDTALMPGAPNRGTIRGLTIIDKDDLGENCDLYFMNASNTFGTRNAIPSITDTVAENIIGIMTGISASKDLGGCRVASYEFNMSYDVQSSGALYLAAVTNTSFTHVAAGITMMFRIERV
jgi:hypothetical protein